MPRSPRSSPSWDSWVRDAARQRPVVLVGTGVDRLRPLARFGADVVGVIGVQMAHDVPLAERVPYRSGAAPVYELRSPVRTVHDLLLRGFGDALRADLPGVLRFLDEVDPRGEAAVVGDLATPAEIAGGRQNWAVDGRLGSQLESKGDGAAPLADVLDWIEVEPAPAAVDASWWRSTTKRLGTEDLVVQHLGLHCGGAGTWLCSSPAEVARAVVSSAGGSRIAPFVDGTPVNVMGAVGDDAVLVLPPSRITVAVDADGRPRYLGNVTGRLPAEVQRALIDDARRAGGVLGAAGYRGPFGLDAVVTPDGRPRYHDLNARANGSARLFDTHVPLVAGLLLLPAWLTSERIELAERELHHATEQQPLARTWLTETVGPDASVVDVRPGRYRIDPDGRVHRVDGRDDTHCVTGDVVLARTSHIDGARLRPGDLVAHGDLFASPDLLDAVVARVGGDGLVPWLLDGLRGAGRD